jgi:catechol 2,3-dioxygenase-like lactoylglutathione lyase family enzyme
MALRRIAHLGVVVDDLPAATRFFVELGMELDGEGSVEGELVDRVVGLEGVRSNIAMLKAPDGGVIELTRFDSPPLAPGDPEAPSNTPGMRHVAFEVDDLDDTLARLRPHGAELIGTVEDYSDVYRLCYVRGPAGMIVELAQKLG